MNRIEMKSRVFIDGIFLIDLAVFKPIESIWDILRVGELIKGNQFIDQPERLA
ncbi:hypothetical protein P6709_06795 [Jeotgalibacillus sp. ET6]|uniref:hypothetical protein n=1 Tax=Jeotgalibacillus sp. ET6 TaxID=3037260 RepID=UPI00241887D8|nr:hypothetical protein [Jeotgalibacillus sp. ET6]MDG5471449.1 hypothetical protein [Jeotgalibacillus sp. ET6]